MAFSLPVHKLFRLISCIIGGSFVIRNCEAGIENQYVGCYYDNVNQINWKNGFSNSNNLSIEQCIGKCSSLGSTYAILQSGRNCFCGDIFNANSSSIVCNTPCSGNPSEYCGGSTNGLQYYAFYSVCPFGYYGTNCSRVCHCKDQIPCNLQSGVCPNGCDGAWTKSNCSDESIFTGRYIGCYRDDSTRAMAIQYYPPLPDPNPTRGCTTLCAANASTYLGLQYGGECFCGGNYSLYGKVPEDNCNFKCKQDNSQICGGSYVNSVYSVCANGSYGTNCLDRCNCKDKEICDIISGTCQSGCKPGWFGSSCNVRDCSVSNGDCAQNESCSVVDLKYSSVTRCFCAMGYYRNVSWDNCTDLNECVSIPSVCNRTTETCYNTIGSFDCSCNSGLQRINPNGRCEDIDECKDPSPVCNPNTETCLNVFGSYTCACKAGFQRYNSNTCTEISCSYFSLGSVVGAAIGSAGGVTLLYVAIGIIIFVCRRKRQIHQQKKSDGRQDIQNNEMTPKHYETLNEPRAETETTYEQLDNENTRQTIGI